MDNSDRRDPKKSRRRTNESKKIWLKQERNALLKKVSVILHKSEHERSDEEKQVLLGCTEVAQEVTKRLQRQQQLKSRQEEVEDPPGTLEEKCHMLAMAISQAQHLVVYTGAGISTSACIPDYRGPNGVWTLLQQGKDVGSHDLSLAEPTLTHMALSQLYHQGRLKHVVSQNCDGLHLRSGLPRTAMSEVHGNMYLEVCRTCNPPCEYLRLFDVTERTARFNHHTRRLCHICGGPLQDTIVHFGERGSLKWPLNWSATTTAARKADVILCIGSSLKVLKKYPWLWCMDKAVKNRPQLYIINLQWTPKDDQAILKINGRCDEVFLKVMQNLQMTIPNYDRANDPIFSHATPLHPSELQTTSRPLLLSTTESDDTLATSSAVEDTENMPCPEPPSGQSEGFCDDNDCPLDLTMKPCISENSSFTFNTYNTLGIDLNNFPWFSMHYILSKRFCVKEEHNYCRFTDRMVKKGECNFCWSQYGSSLCMFYPRQKLTDRAILSESSEEDEDSNDVPTTSNDAPATSKGPIKTVNPGWFGKGYRKAKLKKKRTT